MITRAQTYIQQAAAAVAEAKAAWQARAQGESAMTSATHTVDFNAEEDELKFRCLGNETSDCHQYPDCECEWWGGDHEHPKVSHGHCWMDEWFANEGTEYTGPDGEVNSFGTKPSKSRTGQITTNFQIDYIEWNWA